MKNSEINIRDPFVLPYDGRYYMYGTRAWNFGVKTSGFDVYIGTDLENWSDPAEVFNSEKYNLNLGVNWAPEVHEYNGFFYMFATFTQPNGLRGTYVLKSQSPMGPFVPLSDGAVTPEQWECLDGTFYIEDGKPFCVYCREHTRILDGTVCVSELKGDLSDSVGEPTELFAASSFLKRTATENCHNVTDGPFMYKMKNGKLIMMWSTSDGNYLQCVSTSDNGSLFGRWTHLKPLFKENGGHGMIFYAFDGTLRMALHCPNTGGLERPCFFTVKEIDGTLIIDNGDKEDTASV